MRRTILGQMIVPVETLVHFCARRVSSKAGALISLARRVLVVTPEPSLLRPLADGLGLDEVEVLFESDPEASLSVARDRKWEVVLVDSEMDEHSGAELAEELVRLGAPVILLARVPTLELALRAGAAGVKEVIAFPPDPDRIRAFLTGRSVGNGPQVPLALTNGDATLVGRNPQMLRVQSAVARLGSSEVNLLLQGEPGTGKRTIARLLHQHGSHPTAPFVEFSCAALPEPLIESELFGHEPGTFPWAISRRRGRLERADGGTLFLDHVDKLPPRLQMRLLQSLDEGAVEHVGGGSPIPISLRIVAAVSVNLQDLVEEGRFLPDLADRLAAVVLSLPPLRERPEDVLTLASHFVLQAARRHSRDIRGFSKETARKVETHDWPGNLRELRSAMEHAVLLAEGSTIRPDALPDSVRWPGGAGMERAQGEGMEGLQARASLEEVEAAHIRRVVQAAGGNLSQAAEVLGIHRNTLRRKLRQYGMSA